MAKIAIVEDDKNISEIESFALKNSGYEVEVYGTAADFFEGIKENTFHLIMLDIMLPDEDGLSILQKIRENKQTRKTPVIMVTAKTTEIDKVRGLDMGADDYITKPFGIMELISRVKALLRRTGEIKEEKFLSLGGIFLDHEKHVVYVNDKPCELTYKEYELCKLLLQNAGIVTSRDIIMDKVWGTDFEGESRTLDMHIKTLRQKLGNHSTIIETVIGVGYRLEAKV